MTRLRRGSLWVPRVLSLLASTWIHLAGVSLGVVLWPLFLLLCFLGGFPADNPYTFRWNNAYFNGTESPDEDTGGEDWIVVRPPRRFRELPEFEKPRARESLNPRKMPFDENLGPPSLFETPFKGPEGSGFTKAKGESLDFVSDKPFRGRGTYDSLGAAGGGGGRYGSAVVLMDAVQWGLLWIARHQKSDGSWAEGPPRDCCGRPLPGGRAISGPFCGREDEPAPRDPIRDTALAVLAFSGAGYTRESHEVWGGIAYGDVLARAARVLLRPTGDPQSRVYALLALASLLRVPSRFDLPDERGDRTPDRGAIQRLLAAVEADEPPPANSDGAAWRALARVRCAQVGLELPEGSLEAAEAELVERSLALAPIDAEAWPGKSLPATYLRWLASFEMSPLGKAELPAQGELLRILKAPQAREIDTCREGSWDPVAGEGRLLATVFHLLALESLPGYRSRLGHPVRPR